MNRVLFLVNNDVGLYNFRIELIEALVSKKYEVHVSVPFGDRIVDFERMGCTCHNVSLSRHGTNPAEDIKLLIYYKHLIETIKPNIVLTYTIKPNIYGGIACSILGIPFVVNITGLGTAVENRGMLQFITTSLYKVALRKAKKIFFQNKDNMQYFIKNNIAIDKHALLPGSGVNLQRFNILDYKMNDTVEFVFISRIMKEKGIDQYLEAAKYLRVKYPYTRFHICGFCEESYEHILDELNEKGTIIYHGMVKDIKSILKNIHCTIHPTYYPEGLSNVLLESSACARPIITTDRAGCREVIEDGLNGFVCKQRDSQDLIKQIEKFLTLSWDERREMGRYGRKKVEKEFNRQIVVDEYLKEVSDICGLQKNN